MRLSVVNCPSVILETGSFYIQAEQNVKHKTSGLRDEVWQRQLHVSQTACSHRLFLLREISADVSVTDSTWVAVCKYSPCWTKEEEETLTELQTHFNSYKFFIIKSPVFQLFESFYYEAAKSGNVSTNPETDESRRSDTGQLTSESTNRGAGEKLSHHRSCKITERQPHRGLQNVSPFGFLPRHELSIAAHALALAQLA